jgi:hypothetical protein
MVLASSHIAKQTEPNKLTELAGAKEGGGRTYRRTSREGSGGGGRDPTTSQPSRKERRAGSRSAQNVNEGEKALVAGMTTRAHERVGGAAGRSL